MDRDRFSLFQGGGCCDAAGKLKSDIFVAVRTTAEFFLLFLWGKGRFYPEFNSQFEHNLIFFQLKQPAAGEIF